MLENILKGKRVYIVISVVIVLGIVVAFMLPLDWSSNMIETDTTAPPVISEVILGTLQNQIGGDQKNPLLIQEDVYTTAHPLALRVRTTDAVEKNIKLDVRLLTAGAQEKKLSPSSATFSPGTSTHCCWTIDEPGNYSFQIRQPSGPLISIPIFIKNAPEEAGGANWMDLFE